MHECKKSSLRPVFIRVFSVLRMDGVHAGVHFARRQSGRGAILRGLAGVKRIKPPTGIWPDGGLSAGRSNSLQFLHARLGIALGEIGIDLERLGPCLIRHPCHCAVKAPFEVKQRPWEPKKPAAKSAKKAKNECGAEKHHQRNRARKKMDHEELDHAFVQVSKLGLGRVRKSPEGPFPTWQTRWAHPLVSGSEVPL